MRHNISILFSLIIIIFNSNLAFSGTLKEIEKKKLLKVCAFSDRLPFSSRDNKLKGFQIELAEEIAKELKVDLDITWLKFRFHARKAGCDIMMEASTRKNSNKNKDIDGVKPLTKAADTEKVILPPTVSIPFFKMETYLVGNEKIIYEKKTLKDIKDLNIGVMRGTWSHMQMQKYRINHRTKFRTEAELIEGLNNKEVDAIFISSVQYWWFKKNNPMSKLIAIQDFNFKRDVTLNIGILLRGADDLTIQRINLILENLLENKSIENIYKSYGIKYVAPS
ncbi:MAG: transporter substrate-binding domain-containing protein [Alphaproteobacteria bacterium]